MNHLDIIAMTTEDPDAGVPALTTLLYRVCGKDEEKFEEACRLVNLFIEQALKGNGKQFSTNENMK